MKRSFSKAASEYKVVKLFSCTGDEQNRQKDYCSKLDQSKLASNSKYFKII